MNSDFHFLDFSNAVREQLPEGQCYKGKFVQIKHEEIGEFIVFSPIALCAYHAQIVERFCGMQEPEWGFEMNAKGDDGDCLEAGVTFIGGGFYEIYKDKKRLNLGGVSQAYGSYLNIGLDEKLKTIDQFKDFAVFC
jgi:hypothetical protein